MTLNIAPQELDKHAIAALTLARTVGIGPVNYHKLIAKYGTPGRALANLPTRSGKPLQPPSAEKVRSEIEATHAAGALFVFHHDTDLYPDVLRHTPDAPPVLVVRGDASLLRRRQVAIVGNRNMSIAGQEFTEGLATVLSDHNIIVTSGGARGVDTAAHEAALAVGAPTIAVIAGGVDHVYPPENKDLFARISAQGCIVTEAPIGETVTSRHFPRRNRIIAGLSLATVVTEASRHSGSLITAQYAGEYGREVFAVPGSPKDSRAAGPNHLLQQGAIMALSAEDVLQQLPQDQSQLLAVAAEKTRYYIREEQVNFLDEPPAEPADMAASEPEMPLEDALLSTPTDKILAALSTSPTAQDTLLRALSMDESTALTLLAEMELMGEIARERGNYWRLA